MQFGNTNNRSELSRITTLIMNMKGIRDQSPKLTIGHNHISILMTNPIIINLPKSEIYEIHQYFCNRKSIIKIQCNHNVMHMDMVY